MKKYLKIFTLLALTSFCVCACGGEKKEVAEAETTAPKKIVKTINVDLTKLSSTMVYSEVYQMVYNPEEYVGKVIKMNGALSIFSSADTGRTYYTCVIKDATACCQQGIEFRLIGNKPLPSECVEGSDVTVVGEFTTYKEGDKTYCELINAKLL